MNTFSDLLRPETVLEGIAAKNKKALLNQLSGIAAMAFGLDAGLIASVLANREQLGSTGFGAGVAIPHGKIANLDHVVGVFVRLLHPIDYQAIDGLPVDLVFVMLSPPDPGTLHLKSLARISRQLRDPVFVAKLRGAGSADALYALWTGDEARNAA